MAENTIHDSGVPERAKGEQTSATRQASRFLSPAVDIYEDPEGLVVVADVPGLTTEDLEINVENDVLTIHGRMTHRRLHELISQEFELVDYFRQFTLSDKVDQERIAATLEAGVLTLRLPKAPHAKPRRIEVASR